MVLCPRLWTLPPSLLLLIASLSSPASTQQLPDPSSLPRDVKYFPEHEALVRRELGIQQRLQRDRPIGMRKMSGDPGEKFYLDYWLFDEDVTSWNNESTFVSFTNSFPLHSDQNVSSIAPRYLDLRRLSLFQKRDYQCPAGTNACDSIGRSNSCCATGSTCQLIQDTGLGDVGCCAAGEVCSGSVSDCGENGYTSCPDNPGGGCCVPGYGCFDVGCVQTSTAVVPPPPTPQVSTTTVTSLVTVTAPGGGLRTLTTTVIVPPVAPTPLTTSSPPPPPPSTTTSISTIRTTTTRSSYTSCPTDFRSCPASYGGGCCHTDRACGYGRECPALQSSGTFSPPARPTDDITTTTFSIIPGAGCPTGFYACSAYYQGGCCQVDRNCDKTSCPSLASTTLVSSPPTIVAPTGSGITAPGNLLTGSCAQGWFTCAPAESGGCCPSGYTCGTVQCTATGTGGGSDVRGKIAPNSASLSKRMENVLIVLAGAVSSAALGLGIWL
jgi:progranulin